MTTLNRHWYALASLRNLQTLLFLMAHPKRIARAMGNRGAVLLHLSHEEATRLEEFGEVVQRTTMEPSAEEMDAALMPLKNLGRRAVDALHPELVELLQKRVNGKHLNIDERKDLAKAIGCDQRDLMPDTISEMLKGMSGPQSEEERRAEIETPFVPDPDLIPMSEFFPKFEQELKEKYPHLFPEYTGPPLVPMSDDLPDDVSVAYGLSGRLRTGELRKGDEVIGRFTEVATAVNQFYWETVSTTGYAEDVPAAVAAILKSWEETEALLADDCRLWLHDSYTGFVGIQNGRMLVRISNDGTTVGWIQELAEGDRRRWSWKSAGDMEGVSSTAPTLNDAVAAVKRVWEDDRK